MNPSNHDTLTPTSLVPPAELSIYTVAELRPQWLAWTAAWAHGEALPEGTAAAPAAGEPTQTPLPTLSAGDIDTVDAAGVQLLLALDRTLAEDGHQLRIHTPSDALRSSCAALGLGDWLATRSAAAEPAH